MVATVFGLIAIVFSTGVAMDCDFNKGLNFNQCVDSVKQWEVVYEYPKQ